jgi:hypothetical protein
MRMWIGSTAAAAVVLACGLIRADDKADGFVPLFDGKSLEGWEIKAGSKAAWSVSAEGTLACKGGGGGWIGTAKQYGDFVLRCEWKVPENGNSGVFIRVPSEKGDPAYTGMEIQVLDDDGPQYKGKLQKWQFSGSIYAVAAPSKAVYKGAGKWNSYEITCKGDSVVVVFNGEKVAEADMSKEAKLAKRPRSGYIGFQNHGSGVEYRNIAIKPLGGS